MHKQTKSTVFKILAVFVAFAMLWNGIAYAAGGDIRTCLAVRTPFPTSPPLLEKLRSLPDNASEMGKFNQQLAYAFLFNIIARALSKKNPLKQKDVINLIEEHLKEHIQAGFLENVRWKEIKKKRNTFYLTIEVQNEEYQFKFFRVDKRRKKAGEPQFFKELTIEDGIVGIEISLKEHGAIDENIREAFDLAVEIGSRKYALDKLPPIISHRSKPSQEDIDAGIQELKIAVAIIEGLDKSYIDNPHHGVKHSEDLIKKAGVLVKELNYENRIDWKVLTAAICLHDIKADKEKHGEEGADFAGQLLNKLNLLDNEQIQKVKNAIILHEMRGEDGTSRRQEAGLEAQILYDIDNWNAFGVKGVYRNSAIQCKRDAPYDTILAEIEIRYNNLIFDATKKLAKDDYEYTKSFFTKLNEKLKAGADVSKTKSGATGVVYYIAQDPDALPEEIARRALEELNDLKRKDKQGKADYDYPIRYFTELKQAYGYEPDSASLQFRSTPMGGLHTEKTSPSVMGGVHIEKEFQGSNISMAMMKFVPLSPADDEDALRIKSSLQNRLREIINDADGCRVLGIGLNGEFALYIAKEEGDLVPEQRLWRMAKQAIEACGYNQGGKEDNISIALNFGTSEMEKRSEVKGSYSFWRAAEKVAMTSEELLHLCWKAVEEENIPITVEDDFAKHDDIDTGIQQDTKASERPDVPPIETEGKDDYKKGGFLDRGRTLADHILVPLYIANIFSVFTLPQGLYSTATILKFMFFSRATLVSLSIWGLVFLIATGWHERGHYIKAIKARTLKKSLLPDAKKNLEAFFIKRFFWNIKIVMLSPLGLIPGIGRKGLTYYVEAAYNPSAAAEGPATSGRLAIVGLIIALITIPLGVIYNIPLAIYVGRVFLGSGVVGMLDFFFADPGEYKKFRQQEKKAKKAAETPLEERVMLGEWKDKMSEIKRHMINTRMHEVVLPNGNKLRAPWQFRNCGMGGRHTEKEYPESNISMQEMMFVPISPKNYEDAQEMTIRLQNRLKEIINSTDGCRVMGVGLEGGLAPYITKEEGDIVPEQRLWRMAKQAIKECGYNKGGKIDVAIALDTAASELQIEHRKHSNQPDVIGSYRFWRATERIDMTRDEILDLYRKAIEEDDIPIISIEDGFAEDDDEGWKLIMQKYGDKLFIVGDDSVTTRDSSIEYAADHGLNNTFLCKANQIGTLSETLLAILVALGKNLNIVVSHRSKSPNDDMEAQIALACDAMGLKVGGGANTERLFKYGSVMETMAKAIREAKAKIYEMSKEDKELEADLEKVVNRMVITNIFAWEEATNAGIPTVGVKVFFGIRGSRRFRNFFEFKGSTPLGTSAGTGEAIHLVDSVIYWDQIPDEKYLDLFEQVEDGSYRFKKGVTQSRIDTYNDERLSELYRRAERYEGKGCLNAVDYVNDIFANAILGRTIAGLEQGSLAGMDRELLVLEKGLAIKRGQMTDASSREEQIRIMQRKGNLGMNAILSQSLAIGRLIAHMQGKELWEILRETLMETMAKTIAANGGLAILPEKLAQKVKPREDQELWQAINESLSFEELTEGLQAVNRNKSEDVKLYGLLRTELPVYGTDSLDGEAGPAEEDPREFQKRDYTKDPDDDTGKKGLMEQVWIIANHISDSFCEAIIFSVLSLPAGLHSKWEVLRFMFCSYNTIITVGIWFLAVLLAIGWHERGHYIKAIKARTLKKSLLPDAQKNLESSFIKRFFWNLKILALGPLGLFPGIVRKGLTYYVDAPYNPSVSAEGPKKSGILGAIGLVTAVITIPLGLWCGIPLIIYIGRWFLAFGEMGTLDFFFTDPREYKKFRQQQKKARKAAEAPKEEKVAAGEWKDKMSEIKQHMINTRMHEVVLPNGNKLRAPWQFRNCGMGGRHTEKEYPESNISMQEMMFVPISPKNYEDAQEMTIRLQNRLKEIINSTDGCRVMGIGLEGGLAPYITKEEGDIVPEQHLWRMAKQAIKECGYNKGGKIDVAIALDTAASELQIEHRKHSNQPDAIGSYRFWRATEKVTMTRDEILDLYRKAIEEDDIPIISIEDGFAEDDDDGWKLIMQKYGDKLFIIGDDSVTTRDSSIERAADLGLNNTFLCKANQIGTLTETLLAILVALGKDLNIVVSHRSKSPNDDMEAQIALACDAMGLKVGGGANTERLFKYGSVMETMAKAVREAKAKIYEMSEEDKELEADLENVVNRMVITNIFAWEEATNAGIPTVGVKVFFGIRGSRRFRNFFMFKGSTPLGTSAGTGEAIHLVDSVIYRDQIPDEKYLDLFEQVEDGSYRFKKGVTQSRIDTYNDERLSELYRRAERYEGKGCLNAVDNVNTVFAKIFMGKTLAELGSLTDIDRQLLVLERELAIKRGQMTDASSREEQIRMMQRKGNLGMNAVLSQSLAMGRLIAHMQGKELWEILRETLMETMAKTIAANGGKTILPGKLTQKVKPREDQELWQALNESLSFEELTEGLQAVNSTKSKDVKLYELLRKELSVYEGDTQERKKDKKDDYNLAKMKGDVPHRKSTKDIMAVNPALDMAFDPKQNKTEDFTTQAQESLRDYLERPDIREKLKEVIEVKELLTQLTVTEFILAENPKNNSPTLTMKDRDNYQPAHVGLERKSAYFSKVLVQDLAKDNPALLAVFLTRELACLYKALNVFNGKDNYDKAMEEGEKFGKKVEQILAGNELDEYIQKKVDEYLDMEKQIAGGCEARGLKDGTDIGPSLRKPGEGDYNLAKMKGDVPHRKNRKDIMAVNPALEMAFDPKQNKTEDFTTQARDILKKYLDREDIREKLKGSIKLRELLNQLTVMKFILAENPMNNSPTLTMKDRDNYQPAHVGLGRECSYFSKVLVQDLAKDNPALLAVFLTRELACLYAALDAYNGANYNDAMIEGEKFGKKVEEILAGKELNEYIQRKFDEYIKSTQKTILLASGDVTPEMRFSVGEKAVLLAGAETYLQEQGNREVKIPGWFVLPKKTASTVQYEPSAAMDSYITNIYRDEFDKNLREIAKGSDLEFGNAEHPLLVAVRDSMVIDKPGRGVTILNVGITDKTVTGLAGLLGSEKFAYKLYAELIRDIAIATGEVTAEDFSFPEQPDNLEKDAAYYKKLVNTYKTAYKEKFNTAFPQDPYEQLHIAIALAVHSASAGRKAVGVNGVNAVMVQKMSHAVFTGMATSRDPLTGDKKVTGTAKKGIQGDDIEAKEGVQQFQDLMKQYPAMGDIIDKLAGQIEKHIKNMALIEFVVEKDITTQELTLNLLQVKNGLASKTAYIEILYDLQKKRIITEEEVLTRLEGIHLETLKYEPVQDVPEGAIYVGEGRIASPGIVVGVAVCSEEKAREYRAKGVPAILVKPVITAADEGLIKLSAGVIALEEFLFHVQDLSLKYRVPAVVGIKNSSFDDITRTITFGKGESTRMIKEGETMLMIMPDGRVYIRDITLDHLQEEHLSRRKKYLEEPLVEVMCSQMEQEGYEPALIIDRLDCGFNWGKIVRETVNVKEYRRIKNETTYKGKPILQGVHDVIKSTEQPVQEIEIEERTISQEIVNVLALEVIKYAEDIANFTFHLWEIYDNFEREAAKKEGVELRTPRHKIVYTNLEESQGLFVKKIAEDKPEMFVRTVFYGVDKHGMSRYIFRSYVVKYLKKPAAQEFFKQAIKFGAQHGYSGDDRMIDCQAARLFSHFAKEDPDFASEAIAEFEENVRDKLLNELYVFYIHYNLYTKAFDSGFADFQELLSVLNEAVEKFNKELEKDDKFSSLRSALQERIALEDTQTKNTYRVIGTGFNPITNLDQILEKTQKLLNARITELEKITVKESEKPNAIILYADDIIDKGAVLDIADTLQNEKVKQSKILSGGKVILYVKKRKKEDKKIQGLKKLIEKADPTIDVFIKEKSDLYGSNRRDFNEMKEMKALKNEALRKLNGDKGISPQAEQLLGIIRGHSNDMGTMYKAAKEVEIPVVVFGNLPGIYSFAEALREAIIIRNNPERGWYKYLSMPVQRLDPEAIRKEFETYVRQILVKA